MSKEILVFKLVSGEEVIATLVSVDDVAWEVEKPRVFHIQSTGTGEVNVGLMPLLLSNRNDTHKVKLSRTGVIATCKPELDMEKMYLQQTSGIAIATSV